MLFILSSATISYTKRGKQFVTKKIKMEAIIDEEVSPEDFKKFENAYNKQMKLGPVSHKAQFEYAWCLVRRKHPHDLKHGVALLEDLFHKATDDQAKRDYLYYLAVGHTRLKDYDKALKYTKGILAVEPKNHQASQLKQHIEKKMRNEGLVGMAIVGGAAAVAVGGIIGLGMALTKK